jgi:hypothetical protein
VNIAQGGGALEQAAGQPTFSEHSVNSQGTFSQHSVNVAEVVDRLSGLQVSEHSVNIQYTFSQHSVNIQ